MSTTPCRGVQMVGIFPGSSPGRLILLVAKSEDYILLKSGFSLSNIFLSSFLAGKRYQLDIDVSKLAFTHHPLFSKEHVLVSRLQQLYNQYCVQMRKGTVEHLTSKVITSCLKVISFSLQILNKSVCTFLGTCPLCLCTVILATFGYRSLSSVGPKI